MKRVMEKALRLRDNINAQTGYNDTNITSGVQRLFTDDRRVFTPQLQIVPTQNDCEVSFDGPVPEFQELEYLQSNGSQYIKTGIVPTNNTRIIFDFECYNSTDNNHWPWYFGAVNSNKTNMWGFWQNTVRSGFAYTPINQGAATELYPLNTRHTIEFINGKILWDGVEIYSDTPNVSLSDIQIYLFATNKNNSSSIAEGQPSYIKLHRCQIYEDIILERDYVGAKNIITNSIGLLDRVHNLLYLNSGSGSFTPGPIISGGE